MILAIMAAGFAVRFGGIKQLLAVGPDGEILMDYAIREAQYLGFTKVIIITREELVHQFIEHFKQQNFIISIDYICQDKFTARQTIPEGIHLYGTGIALLSAISTLTEEFIIINGDDYYGTGVFPKMSESFKQFPEYDIFLAGYQIKNTLSPNGSVSRAVCKVNDKNELINLTEYTNILKSNDKIISEVTTEIIEPDTFVSMNCWGFRTSFLDTVRLEFKSYLVNVDHWINKEFNLPDLVKRQLLSSALKAKLIPVHGKWVGLTYHDDQVLVKAFLKEL